MTNLYFEKLYYRFGTILYGAKTPEGEYIYKLFNEMDWTAKNTSKKISYNEAVKFMTEGTNKTEDDVKHILIF